MQDERKISRNPSAPLRDDPAPLSQALHIPTLVGDYSGQSKSARGDDAAPLSDALHIPTLIDESSVAEAPISTVTTLRTGDARVNRAPTPAGSPRADAASLIGAPSQHPQTPLSDRLTTLDKAAVIVGALMTIGPLFAAMVGRMTY